MGEARLEHRYFKLLGDDGDVYIIRLDVAGGIISPRSRGG